MIKALPTDYDGYTFRSKLEARWAAYFNGMNIEYQYEPQGFSLDGLNYLPDMYLEDIGKGVWVEIKGKDLNDREFEKARRLCVETEQPVLFLEGEPKLKMYTMIIPNEESQNGISVYEVNIVVSNKFDSGLLEHHHLNGTKAFKDHGEEGERALNAYRSARRERFGVYDDPLKALF